MEQLSAQDTSFLYQETPDPLMHVGSVALLDPCESPYGPLNTLTLSPATTTSWPTLAGVPA